MKLPSQDKRFESLSGIVLIPSYIMFKYKKYNIIKTHSGYHIKKYHIVVNNKKEKIIEKLLLENCCHPNSHFEKSFDLNNPPKLSEFCLPSDVIGATLVSNKKQDEIRKQHPSQRPNYITYSAKDIEVMLICWGLDDPHHYPLQKHIKTSPQLPKEIRL